MTEKKRIYAATEVLLSEILGDLGKLTAEMERIDKDSGLGNVVKRLEAAADKIEKSPITMGGFDLMPPVQREQGMPILTIVFWFALGMSVMYCILAR